MFKSMQRTEPVWDVSTHSTKVYTAVLRFSNVEEEEEKTLLVSICLSGAQNT